MRGVGSTFSRLPTARALIAGVALLAGSISAQAAGVGEDTAFAMPRLSQGGLDGAGLPQPLLPSDAARLRRIFALQDGGNLTEAAAELSAVSDPLLTGHVLAQRYLGRYAQASATDLAAWLAAYPDHPDASAVHTLLLARLQPGTPPPVAPDVPMLQPSAEPPEEEDSPGPLHMVRNQALDAFIRRLAHDNSAPTALRMLGRVKGLDPLYGGQLRAEVAQALFTQGHDEQALHLAQDVLRATTSRIALAGYVGGLAAWRLERPEVALPLFESASRAPTASTSLRAAAAFWAARAHLRARDAGGYRPWMRTAAEARHTFYGLLARRVLGMDLGDRGEPARDTLGDADGEAMMALPHGRRALGLLQVGQPARAEAELRALWPSVADNPALAGAVLRVAEAGQLTGLAAQLAGLVETTDGRSHDDARFPLPVLHPAGGWRVDPALVYGLARSESNFDHDAVSSVGAQGLMQLMPLTASYMGGDGGNALSLYTRRLHDPATNLSLGQSYVLYLSKKDGVNGDLIRLLASYNAGPASFTRMMEAIPAGDDPLLFIESIPNTETRTFVPRVLAFSWIYAARLHLPAPSLDELAAGGWPVLHSRLH